ncbi:hypothetical protein H2198_008615 [Neophaeococcomyces mojaviensis]|uniref:Uncharacterized protein n=1 Tax=Neophaeococcomyces mojaviensis TaxID=3383035 RepID=A0ACC2ZWS7_9EURO|nr:hypothetical protein H2198_008615 [Knufia sp. JES_112]
MVLVEDDTILHPEINEDSLLYISSLNEDPKLYTRFFDALLIKRNLHRSLFRDLKAFRQQPQLISLLENAAKDKTKYKDVTIIFLGSRFAHPWCRKTPLKKGFWRAEWSMIDGKPKDAEITREEQRLHKLLVPIWIIMRSKMFPGEEIVKAWCIEEKSRLKENEAKRLTVAALRLHDEEVERQMLNVPSAQAKAVSWIGNDDDIDDGDDGEIEEKQQAAHAATSVFRLAAAGVILSQTPKRKLRWLIKKP